MAIEAGDVVWNITGNLEPLNKALGESQIRIQQSFGNVLQAGRQVGIAMTAVGATITGFMGIAVSEAAKAEQANAQLEAVIKSTGGAAGVTADEMRELASSLQAVTTYDDETILGAESLLLTFTKIGKEVMPDATKAVLDMSTAIGTDLKSSAIQIGKALNDPILGATALRRVGVQLTEQQQEQIKVFVESGNVMAAQKIILNELATEFGGSAAAAANTFTGSLQQLQNQIGDMMETIGAALMPVLKSLMSIVVPIVQSIAAWVQANPQLTETIVLVVAAIGGIMTVLGPLLVILPGVVSAFGAVSAVVGVVAGAFGAISAPVLAIAAAIGVMLVGAIYALQPVFAAMAGWVRAHWEQITAVFNAGVQLVGAIMTLFGEILRAVFTVIGALFDGWGMGISDAWNSANDASSDGAGSFLDVMQRVLEGTTKVVQVIGAVVKWLADFILANWDTIAGATRVFVALVVTPLFNLANSFIQVAQVVVNSVSWILNAIAQLPEWLGFGGGQLQMPSVTPPQIPGFAAGGIVPGGLTRVGERGEELLALPTGTRVMSNAEMRSAAAQGGDATLSVGAINVTVSGGGERSARELASEIVREVDKQLLSRLKGRMGASGSGLIAGYA